MERYIALLEDKVIAAEDRLQQMREEHRLEVGELEREFDVRIWLVKSGPEISRSRGLKKLGCLK